MTDGAGVDAQPRYVSRANSAGRRRGPGDSAAVRYPSDLEDVLRRRLRLMAILPLVGIGALLIIGLLSGWQRYMASPAELFTRVPYYGIMSLVMVVCAIVTIVLAPGRGLSVDRLRTMEWVAFAPVVLLFSAALTLGLLEQLPELPQLSWNLAMATSLTWAAIMVQYGIFIPNTWQRCAGAVGLIALCALVPDAYVLWHHDVASKLALTYMAVKAQFIGFFAALSIYGSHRIDVLQQDALDARSLGQYVLKQQLRGGGMGEVHLAEHRLLRRPCAVKVIREGQHRDANALARFEREVQATASLTHPNSVQIFDYGRTDDGTFFYAMEYLPGLSLDEMVEQHGALPPARVVHFLVQLCGALGEAHGRGLLHRDIKPGNVIICERGGVHDVAKLLDFGLVTPVLSSGGTDGTRVNGGDAHLTLPGVILGTPAFMSPEQCAGDEALTAASDIYGLGALGYYLLTGRVLFPNRTPMQMLAAHMYEAPAPMAGVGVMVSSDVEAIIVRCLSKEPAQRFESAASLEHALRATSMATAWSEAQASAWWASTVGNATSRVSA